MSLGSKQSWPWACYISARACKISKITKLQLDSFTHDKCQPLKTEPNIKLNYKHTIFRSNLWAKYFEIISKSLNIGKAKSVKGP